VLGAQHRGLQLGFSEVYDALKPRSEETLVLQQAERTGESVLLDMIPSKHRSTNLHY
jgi:hypothetical protein